MAQSALGARAGALQRAELGELTVADKASLWVYSGLQCVGYGVVRVLSLFGRALVHAAQAWYNPPPPPCW